MVDRSGEQIGNYRLVRLLGTGGFADVYLGQQVYLDSSAAIKLLHTHLAQADWEDFRAEARTLVRLLHPHIIRLLDFGLDGSIPFLVMDYAPNGTLRQRHSRGERLPLATVVEYVNQIASALQFAHDQKVIHRDIKPENMLVGRNNEILLTDFGIAIVAQSTRTEMTQETVGTIAYMAPEQIQSHPRPASDQYSLGVVVFEWLSGQRPFNGTFTELAVKHMMIAPPSLIESVPDIPPDVEQVVLTTLAKDPKQRFGSVQAFATALERASNLSRPVAEQETLLGGQLPLSQPQSYVVGDAPTQAPTRVPAPVTPIVPVTPLPPLPVAPVAGPTGAAHFVNTPDRLHGEFRASGIVDGQMATVVSTPQNRTLPMQPPPVQRPPQETGNRKVSRRAFIFGGVAVGIIVVGGVVLYAELSRGPHTAQTSNGTPSTSKSPTATRGTTPPAVLAQDTFQRADQQFWGTATDNMHTWGGDAGSSHDFSIAGHQGQILRTAAGTNLYTATLGDVVADAEVLTTGFISTFTNAHFGAMLRWSNINQYYKAYIDGQNLRILRRPSPASGATIALTPFVALPATSYSIRFRAVGTLLQAKAWPAGTTEPANWMVSVNDSALQSGSAGLRPQLDQNTTLEVTLFTLTAAAGA